MLYASLFNNPETYVKVIQLLAQKKMGLTRVELLEAGGFEDNGRFSEILHDLEWCGFVRSYTMMGYDTKNVIYQLMDHYTLFYYDFIDKQSISSNYWSSMIGTPKYNTWCGLAFERVGLWHAEEIKKKLGISGKNGSFYVVQTSRTTSLYTYHIIFTLQRYDFFLKPLNKRRTIFKKRQNREE